MLVSLSIHVIECGIHVVAAAWYCSFIIKHTNKRSHLKENTLSSTHFETLILLGFQQLQIHACQTNFRPIWPLQTFCPCFILSKVQIGRHRLQFIISRFEAWYTYCNPLQLKDIMLVRTVYTLINFPFSCFFRITWVFERSHSLGYQDFPFLKDRMSTQWINLLL